MIPTADMPVLQSIDPYTGETLGEYPLSTDAEVEAALNRARDGFRDWSRSSADTRAQALRALAGALLDNKATLATMVTREMGKLYKEAQAEVEKCALVCRYYADHGPAMLEPEVMSSDFSRSYAIPRPLGVVLAVMPWNFPVWQVFRFLAPALMVGNTVVLKHAANVTGCALAMGDLMNKAGLPAGLMEVVRMSGEGVPALIADDRIAAATLTGSEAAGRSVGAAAGKAIKKSVLELGGSDAFVVLDDAPVEEAVRQGLVARYMNAGQSCIAGKRFILTEAVADRFTEAFLEGARTLVPGNPMAPDTRMAPMARTDLAKALSGQVEACLARGARLLTGHLPQMDSALFPASVLTDVTPEMPAWCEEFFGPVATFIRVRDADEALRVANDSPFGLGGCVWTQDLARGERFALEMHSGSTFVNAMMRSDPRLPFGGVGLSGYGRELSVYGLRELANMKTIAVAG
jgi:succinate-semialdehyde dehydrogenase/glutarate-semialdehyde dehydrogenase